MTILLPQNGLSTKLLPQSKDTLRFPNDDEVKQVSRYEIIDLKTKRIWGYVSIDNTQRGPGLGGMRMVPDISLNEVNRLARIMTLKNSAACIPYGGGKAGLVVNEPDFYNNRSLKTSLMNQFAAALFQLNDYVPAADMGTDELDVQVIFEHHCEKLQQKNHNRGGAGRPYDCGGIPIDDWELTAHGLFAAAQTLENFLEDFKLNNSKVVIQGFGNVGCPTAIKLNQMGALIVGASDINCGLWNPNGLDLEELCKIRKLAGGLSNYSGKVEKRFGPDRLDWLLEAPCDILVPAARPDAITSKNIDRINCRIILQGANTPSSKPVEYYLKHRKNILSLTDFIVNAGGVIGCAVERKMMQDKNYANNLEAKGPRAYTENLIFNTVSRNVKEIFQRMEDDHIFRDAAVNLALERLTTQEVWL